MSLKTIQTATTRRALMSGLWSGRSCDAPPAAPAVEAAAAAAPAGA